MGRTTREIELRHTQSGKSVASFSIAVNRDFKSEGQPEVDFFDIVAWGKTGEFASTYVKKGMQIAINGRLQNRDWTDKDGNKRKNTEVIANNIYFADSKKNNDNASGTSYSVPATTYTAPSTSNFEEIDENSDDLPF